MSGFLTHNVNCVLDCSLHLPKQHAMLVFYYSDAFDANFGVGILRVSKGFDISQHITEDELILACKYPGWPGLFNYIYVPY